MIPTGQNIVARSLHRSGAILVFARPETCRRVINVREFCFSPRPVGITLLVRGWWYSPVVKACVRRKHELLYSRQDGPREDDGRWRCSAERDCRAENLDGLGLHPWSRDCHHRKYHL